MVDWNATDAQSFQFCVVFCNVKQQDVTNYIKEIKIPLVQLSTSILTWLLTFFLDKTENSFEASIVRSFVANKSQPKEPALGDEQRRETFAAISPEQLGVSERPVPNLQVVIATVLVFSILHVEFLPEVELDFKSRLC